MAAQRPRPLDEILQYRHPEIVARFCDAFFVDKRAAQVIWQDMLRYLWLVTTKNELAIEPPRVIDEMWHMFIVYTQDYEAWSKRYFGAYLHHQPRTKKEKRANERLMKDPEQFRKVWHERMTHSISTVWDQLGERVALRWFVTYPARYTSKFWERRPAVPLPRFKFPRAILERASRLS